MMKQVKNLCLRSYDLNDEPSWSGESRSTDPETPSPPWQPEPRPAGPRCQALQVHDDSVSVASRKSIRSSSKTRDPVDTRGGTTSVPLDGRGGLAIMLASGAATNGQDNDFTPYGYVSRPGSTPLSYSLWGSNASTTSSEESYRRHFSRSLCRVVFGCAVLLVILAVLGIVGIAVYLGVELRYTGELVVMRGDSWIPDLAVPESPAFKAKASKYEKMLMTVYEKSFLKGSMRKVKVVRFLKNPASSRGLTIHFRLALDRRKMPSHVDNTELAVQDVLLQEIMSLEPVAFHNVAVNIDSLHLARETEAGSVEVMTAAPASQPREDDVQVIKVEGTQEAPGGAIMIRKPSGSPTRKQEKEELPKQEVEEPGSSTVANLVYQFGPWRPIDPFNVFRPYPTDPPPTNPSPPEPPARNNARPFFSPTLRPLQPSAIASRPAISIVVTDSTSTSPKPTTTATTTTTTVTPSTSPTTIVTTTISALPVPTSTIPSHFIERVGIAGEGSGATDDRMITTKRNPSKDDFQAFLVDLLFFTTPRPQSAAGVTRPQPQLPHRVSPSAGSSFSGNQGRPQAQDDDSPNTESTHITLQKILDHNRRYPSYATSHSSSISNTATSISMQTPGVPKVTSYSGVREPLSPRPPPVIQFPQDKFRYPSSSSSAPTFLTGTTRFSIFDFLTTRKPLILNTELVTSTSTDIEYGSTNQLGTLDQKDTIRHFNPVYIPTSSSSLAPVYRPDASAYPHDSDYGTTDQYSPVYKPSRESASLKDFTKDKNYVTVPVISGNNVRYMMVNKTRSNYPNVVIVNLQTTPGGDITTPMTPVRGDSRRLNTKFLEDAFKAILQSSNYRGVNGKAHADDSSQGFSNRQGKPIDLDVPDSPAPLFDSDTHESISLWSFLRNLSQVYLSDPAIIQQLHYFEKAALGTVNKQISTTERPLQSTTPMTLMTSTPMTSFFQHLQGSADHSDTSTTPFLKNSNAVASQPSEYTYIPLRGEATKVHASPFPPKMGTVLRNNPEIVMLESVSSQSSVPAQPKFSSHPHRSATSSPYTTLFMTGVEGKSSSNPQIISVSSRSPSVSFPGSPTTNSPIHTFVLKDGQSMEELLQEIFDNISLEEENETHPSTDAPDSDIETTTSESEATYQTTHTADSRNSVLESINQIIFQCLQDMTNNPENRRNRTMTSAPTTTPYTTTPIVEETTKPFTIFETTRTSIALETTETIATVKFTKPSTTHNYNLELFPVMTRPMSPIRTTTVEPYEILDDGDNEIKTTVIGNGMVTGAEERTETSVDVSYSVHTGTTEYVFINNRTASVCRNPSQFQCGSGECISEFSRCNLMQDCRDNSDEVNCTCSDFLKSKFLNRKICDGIVDCWDHSDESNCDWCQPGQFICSGSSQCIEQSQVCDGTTDCESGDDEKTCVTLAPDLPAANSLDYHHEGYLMVRKKGVWGKLCLENFERVTSRADTSWTVSDLGQAVCKTLTFNDFTRVERQEDQSLITRAAPRLPPGFPITMARTSSPFITTTPTYFEIHVTHSLTLPSRARSLSHDGDSTTDLRLSLEFEKTSCPKKDVVRVTCSNLQCGMRPRAVSHRARIVGGNNSGPGSWPWHAALYKEGEYQCGATLINSRWLVSAGHCFFGATANYWVARLGALRRGTKFPSPYEQLRHITHIFIHPEYEDTGFINDISLLRVEEPVKFTDYVRPVCLPPSGAPVLQGRLCTLVGWGQLFEVGKIFPDTLQEVQVPLISTSECRKRTVFIPLYRITDDMFCAGYDRGGRDACLGDSGGPLMCQEPDGGWQLVGVTSNGYGCARPHRPGVYTKVVKYLDWMNQVMELTKNKGVVPVSARCEGRRCPLGQCLPRTNICNGFVECSDGSDEKNCD